MRLPFTKAAIRIITSRATDMQGRKWCEQCGAECLTRADYEIDHIVAEGVQPANDNRSPLTADDGKLLCLVCHDKKTERDVARSPGRSGSRRSTASSAVAQPRSPAGSA